MTRKDDYISGGLTVLLRELLSAAEELEKTWTVTPRKEEEVEDGGAE